MGDFSKKENVIQNKASINGLNNDKFEKYTI